MTPLVGRVEYVRQPDPSLPFDPDAVALTAGATIPPKFGPPSAAWVAECASQPLSRGRDASPERRPARRALGGFPT